MFILTELNVFHTLLFASIDTNENEDKIENIMEQYPILEYIRDSMTDFDPKYRGTTKDIASLIEQTEEFEIIEFSDLEENQFPLQPLDYKPDQFYSYEQYGESSLVD